MLHNEFDLVDALYREEGFARLQARCLWFAYEYDVVDSGLLVAAGLAEDAYAVSQNHMIGAPTRHGWLVPTGTKIAARTRPYSQHQLTPEARTQMARILAETLAARKQAAQRIRLAIETRP